MADHSDKKNNWFNEVQIPLLPEVALVIPLASLLPDNPFKSQAKLLNFSELLDYPESEEGEMVEKEKDDELESEPAIILAKAIEEFYEEAPAMGEEVFKQGFQPGRQIVHSTAPSALHIAARNGDLKQIQVLINKGFKVNAEDHLSSTPLHVAALFGKTAAVSYLLQHGANIHDLTYDGYSAIQLAINKGFYATAQALVTEGKVNPNQMSGKGDIPMNLVFDAFIAKMKSPELASAIPKAIEEAQQLLQTIKVFADFGGSFAHYAVPFVAQNTQSGVESQQFYKFPISMQLKIYACFAPNETLKTKILQTADHIYTFDKSEKAFLSAKNLLNVFPTGKIYYINIGNGQKIIMKADGHFKLFTTELAKNSLATFNQQLAAEAADPIKVAVFNRLTDIYQHTLDFIQNVGKPDAVKAYYERYEQGKTILIPSGWDGHFVTLFASLPQKVVGIGNSGERYASTQSGITFYKTADALDPEFVQEMALNQSKKDFEFDKMYEYGLLEKIGSITTQEQKYGNCTWESHRDAIEGMILIELLNLNVAPQEAKNIAHHYFESWDHFHGHYQLQEYLQGDAVLPAKALIDIFSELHQKSTPGKFTEHEQQDAKTIMDTLVSPKYAGEFKYWLSHDSFTEKGTQLKSLFSSYGLEVTQKGAVANTLSDLYLNEAIAQFKATHKNVGETHSAPEIHTALEPPETSETTATCALAPINTSLPALETVMDSF